MGAQDAGGSRWFAKGELLFQLEPLLLLFWSSTFGSFTLKSTAAGAAVTMSRRTTTTPAKANNVPSKEGRRWLRRDQTSHYTEKPLKSVLFKHCFIVFRNYGYKKRRRERWSAFFHWRRMRNGLRKIEAGGEIGRTAAAVRLVNGKWRSGRLELTVCQRLTALVEDGWLLDGERRMREYKKFFLADVPV